MDNKNIVKYLSPLEKFALFFTKEPFKSFRKANIVDGNDMLTQDGANMFLNYLLRNKFGDEFNTDIVQNIIKEEETKE